MENKIVLELFNGPDNPRNSEGSFAALRDGRIVFIYSHYYGKEGRDHSPARLCARYSSDGGRTWTADDVVVLENEGHRNVMSVSLLRLQDGRLGLWYARKDDIDNCHTDDAVLLAYCCGGGGNSQVLQDLCIRRVTLDWIYG